MSRHAAPCPLSRKSDNTAETAPSPVDFLEWITEKTEMADMEDVENQEKTGRTGDSDSVRMDMDGQEICLEELVADAKVRNLNIVEIFQKHFAVEEVEI